MVRITEQLIRKRAEHNEGEIHSLQELSLHQQNLEKIEYLDKWCRQLKILYLQNNLLPRIENVSRLKDLEYLNLALNNIERIENLQGCESLRKLDLTVNFIGELTSIDCLTELYSLEELFLTGNPCTDYPNYRDFVVATLPQLRKLDGIEITKSERIIALQKLEFIRLTILDYQRKHEIQRNKEKTEATQRTKEHTEKLTACNGDIEETVNEFWQEKVPFTPESRVEMHNFSRLQEEAKNQRSSQLSEKLPKKNKLRLFSDDGRPYNVNEPKIGFTLNEVEAVGEDVFLLDVAIYRHMDTSLVDCSVQTTYVRITLRGKVLQLALPKEVNVDRAVAKRSQTTGHLVVTMPIVDSVPRIGRTYKNPKDTKINRAAQRTSEIADGMVKNPSKDLLKLEEEGKPNKMVDWKNIVHFKQPPPVVKMQPEKQVRVCERGNSPDFVDSVEVPPLV